MIPGGVNAMYYSFGDARQLAILYGNTTVLEGIVDDEMVYPTPGLSTFTVSMPRLTPDTEELVVRVGSTFQVYQRFGTQWLNPRPLGITTQPTDELSAPTRLVGGARHILVGTAGELREYVGDTMWQLVATYTNADLGVGGTADMVGPNLSADGLHLVVRVGISLLHADRSAIDAYGIRDRKPARRRASRPDGRAGCDPRVAAGDPNGRSSIL